MHGEVQFLYLAVSCSPPINILSKKTGPIPYLVTCFRHIRRSAAPSDYALGQVSPRTVMRDGPSGKVRCRTSIEDRSIIGGCKPRSVEVPIVTAPNVPVARSGVWSGGPIVPDAVKCLALRVIRRVMGVNCFVRSAEKV